MKVLSILFIIVFINGISFGGQFVINKDKPLKGEWKYNLKKVWEIDSAGSEALVNLNSINVDKTGNIYCVERKLKKIFVFNSDGKFLYSIGKKGEGPGEYVNLYNIHLKGNSIIIPDQGRFHYFTRDGKYIETKKSGIGFVFPRDFINKDIFVHQKPKKGFAFKMDLLNIHNIKTNKSINLCEITLPKPVIAGTMRHYKLEIIGVVDQFIFYGERKKYLIKKFDLSGKKVLEFTINGRKRNKVSKETRRKKWANEPYRGGLMPEAMVNQAVKNESEYAPFFKGINIHNDLIFVLIDDPDRAPIQQIDIFSMDGKYLYNSKMIFPKDLTLKTIPLFKGKFIYIFAEDSDGEGKLIKFKADFPNQ